MTSPLTTLYLVRHGATEANERVPPILQGNGIDLPLNANGRRQAAQLATFFRTRPLDAIYSSAMLRAQETALAIAEPHGLHLRTLPQLHEVNVGEWEGLDWETIRQRYPEAHARFTSDPAAHENPGGESYRDVWNRAAPVLDELFVQHAGQTIVVVAHNVVNRVYLAQHLGLELSRSTSVHQTNGAINLLRGVPGQKPTIVTMNSAFHLRDDAC